jgi:hypothetical protein
VFSTAAAAGPSSKTATPTQIGGLAVLGTVLSIVSERFYFGVNNNVYHIPIVLKLFDMGQFSNDPFYQSLRNFTSLVWPGLSLIATPANVHEVFLGAHIASRFLLYIACVLCLFQLGLRTPRALTISVLLMAFGRVFQGYSMIGATGLQIDYFTHTELAYPLLLFSLILAAQGRYVLAFAVNGITFDVNAFVGIWLMVILLLLVATESSSFSNKVREILAGAVIQAVIALPVVFWILKTVRESAGVANFDYKSFVAYYFPKHFLIQTSSPRDIVLFVMASVSGGIALYLLGPAVRSWRIAFAGFIALFGFGAVLPEVSSSRLLMNLLFLRIDGVVILLSLLFTVRAAMAIVQRQAGQIGSGLAIVVLATLALGDWRLTAISMTLVAYQESRTSMLSPASAPFICLVLGMASAFSQVGVEPTFQSQYLLASTLCFMLALLENEVALMSLGVIVASINFPILCAGAAIGLCAAIRWKQRASRWVVACAGLSAVIQIVFGGAGFKTILTAAVAVTGAASFLLRDTVGNVLRTLGKERLATVGLSLVSLLLLWCAGQRAMVAWIEMPRSPQTLDETFWKDTQQWARTHTPKDAVFLVPPDREGFQLGSDRNVWVDWRQGAAIMWSPSFYGRWISRYPEVLKLKTHPDFYNYAHSHGIYYFVIERSLSSDTPPHPGETHLYRNPRFDIYRLSADAGNGIDLRAEPSR